MDSLYCKNRQFQSADFILSACSYARECILNSYFFSCNIFILAHERYKHTIVDHILNMVYFDLQLRYIIPYMATKINLLLQQKPKLIATILLDDQTEYVDHRAKSEYEWRSDVLQRIRQVKLSELPELLPKNWISARKKELTEV